MVGAQDYLIKGTVTADSLARAIRYAIERHQAQQALRESEECYRLSFEQASDVIYSLDPSDRITSISPSVERILGYRPEELIGRQLMETGILSEADLPQLAADKARVLAGERPTSEYRVRAKDGTIHWGEISGAPLIKGGQIVGGIIVGRDITERKALEDEVALRQGQLDAFFQGASAGLALLDQDLRYVRLNETLAEMNGLPIEEHLGKAVREVVPDLAPVIEPVLRKVLATGEPVLNLEVSGQTVKEPEAQGYWMESYFPIRGADGNVVGVGAIVVEITDRKRAEERVRRSEAELKKAHQVAHVGSWAWHILANRLEWSDEMYRIFGMDQANFSGDLAEVIARTIHPDDRPKVEQANRAVLIDQISKPLEYRVIWPDQTLHVVWAEAGELTLDEAGNPAVLTGIAQDITDRKRAEEALAEREQELLQAQEIAHVGSWTREVRTGQGWWSQEMFRIMGLAPEGAAPNFNQRRMLTHPSDLLAFDQATQRAANLGLPYELEMRLIRPNGQECRIISRGQPVFGPDGQVVRVHGTIQDVTEQRRLAEERTQLERQLQQAQKSESIGRLAAHVAHEINNPLAGIQNAFQLIKDAVPKDHAYFHYVGRIENAIGQIARIVRQMYDLYRPAAERPSEIAVNEVLDEVAALMESICRSRNIQIRTAVSDGPLHAVLRRTALMQVLFNLVHNAVEVSPPGGVVGVEGRLADGQLLLTITDQGPGIPPEVKARMFDPFFTTKQGDQQSGMGLGLSICHNLVGAMNGALECTTAPNRGTTFTVTLPAQIGKTP